MRMMHVCYAALGFAVARWIFQRKPVMDPVSPVPYLGADVRNVRKTTCRSGLVRASHDLVALAPPLSQLTRDICIPRRGSSTYVSSLLLFSPLQFR